MALAPSWAIALVGRVLLGLTEPDIGATGNAGDIEIVGGQIN